MQNYMLTHLMLFMEVLIEMCRIDYYNLVCFEKTVSSM